MGAASDFVRANEKYASHFDKADLPMPPARHVAVLVCMDARIDPARALGLDEGDAHVIRNAGGRATEDAIRSLIISQQLLGTDEVVVIHHTDCGMLTFTNEGLRAQLRDKFHANAGHIDFLPFTDLRQSVLEDMAKIKASHFVSDDVKVSGFVYDVKSGRIQPVN